MLCPLNPYASLSLTGVFPKIPLLWKCSAHLSAVAKILHNAIAWYHLQMSAGKASSCPELLPPRLLHPSPKSLWPPRGHSWFFLPSTPKPHPSDDTWTWHFSPHGSFHPDLLGVSCFLCSVGTLSHFNKSAFHCRIKYFLPLVSVVLSSISNSQLLTHDRVISNSHK